MHYALTQILSLKWYSPNHQQVVIVPPTTTSTITGTRKSISSSSLQELP